MNCYLGRGCQKRPCPRGIQGDIRTPVTISNSRDRNPRLQEHELGVSTTKIFVWDTMVIMSDDSGRMCWSWGRLRRCLNYRSETADSSGVTRTFTVLFIYPLPASAVAGELMQTLVSARRQRDRGEEATGVCIFPQFPLWGGCFRSISSSPLRLQPWRTGTAGRKSRFPPAPQTLHLGRPSSSISTVISTI